MSFVFDEKKATNSLGETSWATGNRTNYIENFRASWNNSYSSGRGDSEQNAFRKEYSLVVDHLHKKGYTGFDNPFKDNEDVPLGPEDPRAVAEREAMNIVEPSREENIISFWDEVKKLPPEFQEEMTTLGYGNQEQFFETLAVKVREAEKIQQDISSRSTFMGKVGNFAGSFSALATEPIVLASLPLGAMYNVPKTILAAAWRVAWVEGLIGAAVEVPIQISAQGFRKDVGLQTEVELFGKKVNLGVLNTLSVGAGSFLLGGLLQGAIKGTPKAVGTLRKALNKSSDAEIAKISKALKIENPQELSKVKEPENPFEDNPISNKIDTENHNAAQNQVLNDVQTEIKPIEAKLTAKSLDDIKGESTIYKPEEIEFDAVNFQYKTDGDNRGVSNKLSDVQEWDNVAAGTILVFEFRNGKKALSLIHI